MNCFRDIRSQYSADWCMYHGHSVWLCLKRVDDEANRMADLLVKWTIERNKDKPGYPVVENEGV